MFSIMNSIPAPERAFVAVFLIALAMGLFFGFKRSRRLIIGCAVGGVAGAAIAVSVAVSLVSVA
jgi:hypothetical protein